MTTNETINKTKKRRGGPIHRIDPNTGEVKEYPSQLAAKEDGFDPKNITNCVLGKKASYKNYIWKYADGSSPEYIEKYNKIFYNVNGTNIKTGNTILLTSHEECSSYGFNYTKIRRSCKYGYSHLDYKWSFVNINNGEIK